ncbi:MAG: potassium channel family protein [Steroidobacteraceae bacterium]
MSFLPQAFTAIVLVTLTICVQSAGMAALIHWGRFQFARGMHKLRPLRSTALMIRFTSLMIGLHLMQIALWAGVYRWRCFPSWESAFYFSTTSYSTVGYGDLVPPQMWRILGPLESVTGVLMCGLSVSLLFAIVTRLVGRQEMQLASDPEMPPVSP